MGEAPLDVTRETRKRTLVAGGHSILVIPCHLLKYGTEYSDLGRDLFGQLHHDSFTQSHINVRLDEGRACRPSHHLLSYSTSLGLRLLFRAASRPLR